MMQLDFDKYKEWQFCDNPACECYGQIGGNNIKINSRQYGQVYCNKCGNLWVITKNTFFYSLKKPVDIVLNTLKLLSEGMGLRAVCRSMNVTADAVLDWVVKAADHVNEVSAYMKSEMHLTQCQIDEFWSFILKKREILEQKRLSGKM
jgi:hypothetical protein